ASCVACLFCLFFFSSRRRHTRCLSDWSSDVCSSDLASPPADALAHWIYEGTLATHVAKSATLVANGTAPAELATGAAATKLARRSEERRVGKECRSRWSTDRERKKERRNTEGRVIGE